MSLVKPGEGDVVPAGTPLGAEVRDSVGAILSAEKPKNWNPNFLDTMWHFLGLQVEQLTVWTKLNVITQNSTYICIVTDSWLKAEDGKIKGIEFNNFRGYSLYESVRGANTSPVRAILQANAE